MGSAQEFWRLADDEFERMLVLSGEAGQMELKLVVPVSAQAATCAALGVRMSRASARRVYFLDTLGLALRKHGIVVRVRSKARQAGDSVIKLRPVEPRSLPGRLRRSKQFVVEVDAMPGNFVCSGALKERLGVGDVERAITEKRPLRKLFSKRQLELFAAHAPAEVRFDDLMLLGPVEVRRAKVTPAGMDRALTVERWTYPDGSRILEISTRCATAESLRVTKRLAAVLRAHRVDIADDQLTKTQATLDYFGGAGRRVRTAA
ncbi:hypothetical protein Ahu01nite_078640 [Winogradskya humida]|uniref:CYTH domain-containing protein n=1 Tax=Winogradskya humida TaxID=113566 RepID=A0ABQ4A1R2_9ACTN|nr:hypothetical protein Ahu01nite_078640 [Actinoplanes humidus]